MKGNRRACLLKLPLESRELLCNIAYRKHPERDHLDCYVKCMECGYWVRSYELLCGESCGKGEER